MDQYLRFTSAKSFNVFAVMSRTMKIRKTSICYILLCVVIAKTLTQPLQKYSNHVDLLPDQQYRLYWKHDGVNITFEVHVRTDGWVGLGFSSSGSMTASDFIVGWINGDKSYVYDLHANPKRNGFTRPLPDAVQNVELLQAMKINAVTILQFRRALDTCDANDMIIGSNTIRVLYAFNQLRPDSISTFAYHTTRGQHSIGFLFKTEAEMPNDAQSILFAQNQAQLPPADTFYWCRILSVPAFERKVHVVRIRPEIESHNMDIVHHIIVYLCYSALRDDQVGMGYNCLDEATMPDGVNECKTPFVAWGKGGGYFDLPREAGLPLGSENDPKFMIIETHYDNPSRQSGRVDSSGLRLVYTQQLRLYDAATLTVGRDTSRSLLIPPRVERFLTRAYCPHECLDASFDQSGYNEITVFASTLHSHLLGRALRMRHVRNGIELPPIAVDDNYDFNFQETREALRPIRIRRGDDLIVECEYDSSERVKSTSGGFKSTEEMCFNFVLYYPRITLGVCESIPFTLNQLQMDCVSVDDEDTIQKPDVLRGMDLYELWYGYRFEPHWTRDKVKVFQHYDQGNYWLVCQSLAQQEIYPTDAYVNIDWEYEPVKIRKTYTPPRACSNKLVSETKPKQEILTKKQVQDEMKKLCFTTKLDETKQQVQNAYEMSTEYILIIAVLALIGAVIAAVYIQW